MNTREHSYFTRAGGSGAELHSPERPGWTCTRCGDPWPCTPARTALAASLPAGSALPLYMVGFLYQAAGELTTVTPRELFDRFLGWTNRRPPPRGPFHPRG